MMADRFTNEAVVLTAPTKPKGGGELELSSMTALTNKTSIQSFFLRVLKVIIQLREAALLTIKKAQKAKKDAETKKKEAEAIANLLENKESEVAKEDNNSSSETPRESSIISDAVAPAMEVVSKTCWSVLSPCHPDLWATLSNWLKELAETPDHHAVVVLQPTVEAFLINAAGDGAPLTWRMGLSAC